MKTGINFVTPIVVLLGVALIVVLSMNKYQEALQSFISEPVFFSSGFASGVLSLVLLLMNSYRVENRFVLTLFSQLLGFCFGVFLTMVIALWIWSSYKFTEPAVLIIVSSLVLVSMPELSYAARKNETLRGFVYKVVSVETDQALERRSIQIGWAGIFVLSTLYVVFWYTRDWVSI